MHKEQWQLLTGKFGCIAVVERADQLVRVCYKCTSKQCVAAVAQHHPRATRQTTPLIAAAVRQLTEYFAGHLRNFDLPLATGSLSPFAINVYQRLLKVPYGSVISYGELAVLAGSPRAARAVGRVMAANPLPLLVPCHRVVNADGRLGQYSAAEGTITKALLLELEASGVRG